MKMVQLALVNPHLPDPTLSLALVHHPTLAVLCRTCLQGCSSLRGPFLVAGFPRSCAANETLLLSPSSWWSASPSPASDAAASGLCLGLWVHGAHPSYHADFKLGSEWEWARPRAGETVPAGKACLTLFKQRTRP